MRALLRALPGLPVLSAMMLVLLFVLAALQYRWTGQLGIAEREQMRLNVQSAVARYAEDFDRELTRALVYFLPQESHGDRYDDALVERHAWWIENAPHPDLVEAVFLARREGDEARLSRLDAEGQRFERLAWDPAFEPVRQALLAPESRGERPRVWGTLPVLEEVPALVVPLSRMPRPGPGRRMSSARGRPPAAPAFAILKLDLDYITGELLPQLTERHFGDGVYRLVVGPAGNDGHSPMSRPAVYRTDGTQAVDPEDPPDATARLFGLLPAHEFPSLLLEAGHSARELDAFGRRRVGPRHRPPPELRHGPRETREDAGKRWTVAATHRSGSLQAAIAAVRFRNLTVSFGILLLLAGSVALILQSARRAQELARQKMDFVAGVSHELRTPLAVICSAGQNLADGVTQDPQRVRDYGRLIRDEGRRLTEMVGQVLEHAAVRSGRKTYSRSRVRVPEVVEAALADCQTLIDEGGFTVDRSYEESLPEVEGDAEALRRAVQNLIVNAVKYAGRVPWIGVRVAQAPRDDGSELVITIEDRGQGIEAAERAQIFEPFFRGADAVAGQIHGNGLGLSLVRQIVEAHGGRASVVSPISPTAQGSAFSLHLPAALPAVAPDPRGLQEGRGGPRDEIDGEVEQPARG